MPYGAVFLVHQFLELHGCLRILRVLYSCGWAAFTFSLAILLWAGASLGSLWASVELDQPFARDTIAPKCRALSLYCLSPEKLLLVGGACSQTRCLPQPIVGASGRLVYVVIFHHHWGSSHFGLVLALVGTSYSLPGLWHHFEWASA